LVNERSRTRIEPLGIVDDEQQRPTRRLGLERRADPLHDAESIVHFPHGGVLGQVGEGPEGDLGRRCRGREPFDRHRSLEHRRGLASQPRLPDSRGAGDDDATRPRAFQALDDEAKLLAAPDHRPARHQPIVLVTAETGTDYSGDRPTTGARSLEERRTRRTPS
jgi:hypothetical protein